MVFKPLAAILAALSLAGCYSSPSDLLAGHESVITDLAPVVAFNRTAFYFQGTGKTVQVCQLNARADMQKPCSSTGTLSLERTGRGNYIVQIKDPLGRHFGLWFRSDASTYGKTGFQCFVWLGEGVVGKRRIPTTAEITWSGTPIFRRIAAQVREVATEPTIDRGQLLKIASIYETELAPLGGDVTCMGETINLPPKMMVIAGDNRHLPDFE